MNCDNINLKEVIEKANKYDELLKSLEQRNVHWECNGKKLTEFFQKLNINYFHAYRDNFAETIIDALSSILDKEYQARKLAEQRRENQIEYQERVKQLEAEMEYRQNELVEAWNKFTAIRSKAYAKTLNEINNEKL